MKKLHILPKLPGVTLIELLIVMGILPLLLLVISSTFGTFMEGQEQAVAQAAINQEQQYLLRKIDYDIVSASDVLLPAADGETGSVLQLQQGADTVYYSPSAITLMRSVDGVSTPVTTTRVLLDSFTVQRLGNAEGKDSIRLTFSLSSTASAQLGLLSRSVTTTYTLR